MKPNILWIVAAALSLTLSASAQDKKPAPIPKDNSKLPTIKEARLKQIESAVPAKATATPKSARKILVFWRCEQFFHDEGIACGNKAIELMGARTGAYTVDISREYSSLDAANLAKYDAVVFNNTTHLDTFEWGMTVAQKQAILDFVRGGKGFVGIHAAGDNFYKWPEGRKMLGGKFAGHPWGDNNTSLFKIDEPNHPLANAFGGKAFKLQTEIYQFVETYTRADRRVLLSLDLSDGPTAERAGKKGARKDGDYAVAWIKKEGKGRVFYCSIGHGGNVFAEPAILQFYLDAIQYALGDLQADDTPKP